MKYLLGFLCTLVLTACGGGGGGGGSGTSSANTNASTSNLNLVLNVSSSTNTVYNDAAGDLNGDGLTDIVVSGWDYDSDKAHIWVFIQNSDGTLSDKTSTYLPVANGIIPGTHRTFIVDLDNDGKNDIFIAGYRDGSHLQSAPSYIFWNRSGQFTQYTFPELATAHGACVNDLNGDGKIDLIVGNVGVYINNGNRSFSLNTTLLQGNNYFSSCAVAHTPSGGVNIVLGNNNYCVYYACVNSGSSADNIMTYDSNLNFLYGANVSGTAHSGILGAVVLDANGDGVNDFVFSYDTGRDVYLNTGGNTYTYSTTIDNTENSMYSMLLTINGNSTVFFSGNDSGNAIYYITSSGLTLYNKTAFTTMRAKVSGTYTAQAVAVYTGSTGKVYILQLLDNSFYTMEMQ